MRTASPLLMQDLTPESLEAGPEADITLVFLRHRGCLFTREWMQELRSVVDAQGTASRVVLVHQGTDAEFDQTLRPLWPDAEAVSDPDAALYAAWSVQRGGFRAMFGLRSWLAGIPAFLRGNRIGWKGKADGWTLPTIVRVQSGAMVWTHRGEQPATTQAWTAFHDDDDHRRSRQRRGSLPLRFGS